MGVTSDAPTDPEAQYHQNIARLERRIADLERVGGRSLPLGGRNLIDNGQMAVNQRASAGLAGHTGGFLADRHYIQNFGIGVCTLYYLPTASFFPVPAGRPRPANMQFIQMTTAEAAGSVAAADYMRWQQALEGVNLQHLLWGTAAAKPLTLSFDCYSTVAATYVCELYRTEATARHSCQTFTVPAGFSTVTLTFPGDTTTLPTNDTLARMFVFVYVGAGSNLTSTALSLPWRNFVGTAEATGVSNNLAATIGNNFCITNMQLEVGTAATPYEIRAYDDELRRCMRYFERIDSALDANAPFGAGLCFSTTQAIVVVPYKVRKRGFPTATYSAAGLFAIYTAAGAIVALNAIVTNQIGVHSVQPTCTTNATQVAGNATTLKANNNAGTFIDISAEI